MAHFGRISLMNLPDEIIEVVTSFLSFDDLMNFIRLGNKRLEEAAKRTLKKSFYIAIIGGWNADNWKDAKSGRMDDVEVVSIKKDAISLINTTIPSLPKGLQNLRGTQLSNHDLLVSGGNIGYDRYHKNDEYLRFSYSSNQWKKVGTMKIARCSHSSVLLNECLYSCGGNESYKRTTNHEVLHLDGRVEEKKQLPIALSNHTANKLNESQYMICGGEDNNGRSSQKTFIYDVMSDDWKEGPSLRFSRTGHCSCVIQSYDETPDAIIVIGGVTSPGGLTTTTEIFKIREGQWIQGPPFPFKISSAACVSLLPTMNFACVVVGRNKQYIEEWFSDVYGLNRSLTSWTHLGKIKKGRSCHIVLPLW